MSSGWDKHPEYGGPPPTGWPLLVIGGAAVVIGFCYGLWPILTAILK